VKARITIRRCLFAVLLIAAAVFAACGGGDNDAGAQDLLNTSFKQKVKSADIALDAQIKLKGGSSAVGPVRIQAKGPYHANTGKLPAVDLDLSVSPGSGGQAISTGFLSTGDRAFVKFQDVYYEQPKAQVEQTNRSLAANQKKRGSLKSLGLDPRTWLRGAKKEGDADVAGAKTTRISGQLDVQNVMRDFNSLIKKSGGTFGGAAGTPPPKPLSDEDINKVADVVKNPTFDVYVGKDDNVVRRVAGQMQFEIPSNARAALGGLQGGSLDFSIQLSKVNGDQKIEAPANARPLSDLTKSLGASGLGGLAGGGAGAPAAPTTPTPPPSGGTGGSGSSGAGGSGGAGSPSADAFKRYSNCLDKANSADRLALQRCAEELKK
jgi:hypothetical protein